MLRLAVFNILPTLFEVLLVTGIIWRLFDWRFAAVTFGAVGSYIGFTVAFTNWRVGFRRTMNDVDSEANTKALDSLLNYETVKYFGNEAHETARFDDAQRPLREGGGAQPGHAEHAEPGPGGSSPRGWAVVMLMAARRACRRAA